MTVPEYLTTFVAIIVSLAVADLLMSLHRLLRARRRVRWFWIPPALALYMLMLAVNFWWGNYFRFVSLTEVSMAQFLSTLASLVVLFLMVAAALPDEVPESGLDLGEWYWENARYFWSLNVIGLTILLTIFAVTHVRTGPDVLQFLGEKILNLILLCGAVLLLFTKRVWVHGLYIAFAVGVLAYTSLHLTIR
ncbi:MAG: hypothetical protein HOP91_03320 [Sphingomonas sp.]|nr:hypothetical protein [Sphingomonas sp.]